MANMLSESVPLDELGRHSDAFFASLGVGADSDDRMRTQHRMNLWANDVFRNEYERRTSRGESAADVERDLERTLFSDEGLPTLYNLRMRMEPFVWGERHVRSLSLANGSACKSSGERDDCMTRDGLGFEGEECTEQLGVSMQRALHSALNKGYEEYLDAPEKTARQRLRRKRRKPSRYANGDEDDDVEEEEMDDASNKSAWLSIRAEKKLQASLQHERHTDLVILKIAFLVVAVIVLIWAMVSAAGYAGSVPPWLHVMQMCFEVLVFVGFSAMLISAFAPREDGFFGIPHPSDQFFSLFAGVILGILGVKALMALILFCIDVYGPSANSGSDVLDAAV